jgi:alkanesulfonate monooxygenase SsuD/methylene tetrahydromethanopterin reductase-like flavin-dependent oxidoreductase (luciferase family)
VGDPALGFVIRPEHPPEALPELARAVEDAGFDELWLWEDCFFAGGIATTATALAATSRVKVGLGIMPAPVRNAAFVAMEIAALARMHPGRVIAGFGHGVADWMRQIGAKPESQLALLEETVAAVRSLLAGEEVHVDGRYVQLDGVRLDHPPEHVPPVFTGVRRTRSLTLSGRVADGTILSEPSSLSYIDWAREQIAATRPHRLTVFAWCNVDVDGSAARAALRPLVEERLQDGGPQAEHLGDTADMDALVGRAGVVGTPEECAETIRALGEAGADSIVLVPQPTHDVHPRAYGELLALARGA